MKKENLRIVPSAWLEKEGRRLDCGPYLSGAIEAKTHLENLAVPKQPLHELTAGHDGGIYNGPQFVRNYVSDPEYGAPFLTGSSMLLMDLSRVELLSKRDANSPKLSYLRIAPGMILVSCSGTIGRMVYARPDMSGYWSCQDILKIVANNTKILPGYLYAFLACRYGLPLVVGGTYGAIIQHIEPSHVWDLPVPRFDKKNEVAIHSLIEEAATMRSKANLLVCEARKSLTRSLVLPDPKPRWGYETPSVTFQRAQNVLKRLDAYYYSEWNQDAREAFDSLPKDQIAPLGEVAIDVFIPNIFKRIFISDADHGFPYLTGREVFEQTPRSRSILSKRVPEIDRLVLHEGMILIQDSGQLGGLIGQPVMVGRQLESYACTNNMVRVVPRSTIDQGYLYILLSTDYGSRLLTREATGSSIPHLEEGRIRRLLIPWPSEDVRERLGKPAFDALNLRDEALGREQEAQSRVERLVEGTK
jgi:type I restriction enzyme, S subunit